MHTCFRRFANTFVVMILIILITIPTYAQKTNFTSHDAIRVNTLRIADITFDGGYIAAILSNRGDRLGTDHKRFGDPTYIAPGTGEFIVIETENGQATKVFDERVQVRSAEWSPDGKILAFFLLKDGHYRLYTYDPDKNRVREFKLKTDKAIASNSLLEWKTDGSGLFINLRQDGWADNARSAYLEASEGPIIVYNSEEPRLKWEVIRDMGNQSIPASVDFKSREVTELLPEGHYQNIRQTEDGAWLSYVGVFPIKTDYTRRGGTEYELKMIDLVNGGDPKTVIEREEKRLNLSWSDDNTKYARGEKGDIFVRSIFDEEERNITKDKVEPEGEDTTKVRFSTVMWSPDGSKLMLSTKTAYWMAHYQSGELEMLYEYPEGEAKSGLHRADPRPRRVVDWSEDGNYVYLQTSATDKWERGFSRLNVNTGRMEVLIKDDNLYGGWNMTDDGSMIFYNFSDGDTPNSLYMADPEFSQKTLLYETNPWTKDKKLTRSELVSYLDVDGKELYGILYYPVDYEPGKKYPLVCEVYEKFFNNGFNNNMNILANAGFFGFRPSVNLVEGKPGEAWMKGVTSAINQQIERGLVDPEKLGIHGTSYGGYATNLIIAHTDRFAAAINISGKVNIISFLGDSPRIGTRNYAAAEVGQDRIGSTLWEAPLKYVEHSAVMYADQINTPLMLMTGEGDWNVPAATTRGMYYALRRLGKECVWVNYWNAGHGAGRAGANPSEFHDHWERIIDWYNTHFDKSENK